MAALQLLEYGEYHIVHEGTKSRIGFMQKRKDKFITLLATRRPSATVQMNEASAIQTWKATEDHEHLYRFESVSDKVGETIHYIAHPAIEKEGSALETSTASNGQGWSLYSSSAPGYFEIRTPDNSLRWSVPHNNDYVLLEEVSDELNTKYLFQFEPPTQYSSKSKAYTVEEFIRIFAHFPKRPIRELELLISEDEKLRTDELVGILSSTDTQKRLRRGLKPLLEALLNGKHRRALVDAGVAPVLIDMLSSPDAEIKGAGRIGIRTIHGDVVQDLICADKNEDIWGILRQDLREKPAEMMAAFDSLLHSEDDDICLTTAKTLAGTIAGQEDAAINHVIPTLIQKLASRDLDVREYVAKALSSATKTALAKEAAINGGAIGALIPLLRSNSTPVQQSAAVCLKSISESSLSKDRMLHAVPVLIHLLSSPSLQTKVTSIGILDNISNDASGADAIRKANPVPALLNTLASRGEENRSIHPATLKVLAKLLPFDGDLGDVVYQVEPLLQRLDTKDIKVREAARKVLKALIDNMDAR